MAGRLHAAASVCMPRSYKLLSKRDYMICSKMSSMELGQCKNNLISANEKSQSLVFKRNITIISKRGKRKTVKGVIKRFKRLGSGALKRWRSGKNHNMRKKSTNQKRRLRKPVIVTGRQLRKLNKMVNGW